MKIPVLLFATGLLAAIAADSEPKESLREDLTYTPRTLAAFDQKLAAARAAGLAESDTAFAELTAAWVHGDAARLKSVLERIEKLKLPEPQPRSGLPSPELDRVREALALAGKDSAAFDKLKQDNRVKWIRSAALITLEDLRQIDAATDQWAIEHNKREGAVATWEDIRVYLKKGTRLERTGTTVFGDSFGPRFIVDVPPNIPAGIWEVFEGTVPWKFFEPFPIATQK